MQKKQFSQPRPILTYRLCYYHAQGEILEKGQCDEDPSIRLQEDPMYEQGGSGGGAPQSITGDLGDVSASAAKHI